MAKFKVTSKYYDSGRVEVIVEHAGDNEMASDANLHTHDEYVDIFDSSIKLRKWFLENREEINRIDNATGLRL